MPQLFKNNARATLGGSGLASTALPDSTFSVATGKGALFPGIDPIVAGTYFDVTIQDATNIEIIRIKKRASDVFTIDSRAREGTVAATFASGAIVSLRLTAAVVESTLSHPAATTGAHAASAISNAPAGNIAATTVQAAINELDAEKEVAGAASSSMSAHTSAPDPHTQYALDADMTSALAGKQAADPTLTAFSGLALTQGSVIYGTGADAVAALTKGTAGQVLTMNPGATAPVWATPASGGVTSVGATAPVTSSGGTTPTIAIPPATSTTAGYMTTAYAAKLDGIQAGANLGVALDNGHNAVGSVCLARIPVAVNAGTTFSGSSLQPAALADTGVVGFAGVLTGTWMSWGGDGVTNPCTTIFQRIA